MFPRCCRRKHDVPVRGGMGAHVNCIDILTIEQMSVVRVGACVESSRLFIRNGRVQICDSDDLCTPRRFFIIRGVKAAEDFSTTDNANFDFVHI